jgi:SAM-dependent methyltransferase
VIEHFNSPSRALKTIHRLVRPHGRLYLECPNLAAPFAAPGRLFHVAHVYNFTPWTLLALAAKCGFELETWLSEPHDSNLEVLLRWVEQGREDLDPLGCSRTKERLACYSTLTYHLRTGYLANRLRKVASYLWEQWAARRFVGRLCAECARPGTS